MSAKTKTDPPNEGWFEIAGVQKGTRDLDTAVAGLGALRHAAAGASVLDLGCAEGLVAGWLMDRGAVYAQGVDYNETRIQKARELVRGPTTFWLADLDDPQILRSLRPSYDIVLLLSILQKLRRPEELLAFAMDRCNRWLAVRTPGPVVDDLRSNHRPLDVVEHMLREFALCAETEGPPWVGIFRRCT